MNSSYLLAWSDLVFQMQFTCGLLTCSSGSSEPVSWLLPWTKYYYRYLGALVNKQRPLTLASLPSVTIFNLLLMGDMSRPPHRHYATQGQVDVISTFIHPFMVSYALGTQCPTRSSMDPTFLCIIFLLVFSIPALFWSPTLSFCMECPFLSPLLSPHDLQTSAEALLPQESFFGLLD